MQIARLLCAVIGIAVFYELIYEISAADEFSYVGAVAEYHPVLTGDNGTEIANENAKNFITMMAKAAEHNADIIVFPENGLTVGFTYSKENRTMYPSFSTFLPDDNAHVPCKNSETVVIEALQSLSCAAQNYSMYVVINLMEMKKCNASETESHGCPSDGLFFYNTNVVLDRNGTIISRYRKFNLFAEPGVDVTSTADVASFTTDFDVTFGHFICFDILFKEPALTLVKDYNITDIVYPTHWFSEMPYLTTLQVQASWSYANDVNFLASSFNNPSSGSGGSGIYAGKDGHLITYWPEYSSNALLVATVPKLINGERNVSLVSSTSALYYAFNDSEISTLVGLEVIPQRLFAQENLTLFTTSELDFVNGTTEISKEVCNREFCCSFHVNSNFANESVTETSKYYKYRIAVFNGIRLYPGIGTGGIQVCSIISCTDATLESCGTRFAVTDDVVTATVFHSIVISGNFSTDADMAQMPSSLTTDILPLNPSDFSYSAVDYENSIDRSIVYNLTSGTRNLLNFAIFGRNFSGDWKEATIAEISTEAPTGSWSTVARVPNLAIVIANIFLVAIRP
ncbi:vanin-like protein 2 [Athalia rosae]|uniref:vanin-like protein 2 n=1 Tax=Athalia rosae TaxID=37344 RepID=UPI002033E8F8|nr:vanin-like protein 2 [Athalia rosae]XP_020711717.2 vanin-like protein 2 [Athalia rosae]XP_048505968.1 vanin-like protein 2 [Athalia rosae]